MAMALKKMTKVPKVVTPELDDLDEAEENPNAKSLVTVLAIGIPAAATVIVLDQVTAEQIKKLKDGGASDDEIQQALAMSAAGKIIGGVVIGYFSVKGGIGSVPKQIGTGVATGLIVSGGMDAMAWNEMRA